MGYHSFKSEDGEESHGSFEVFYVPDNDGAQPLTPGWYWWACFPGCVPDGDAVGPFTTEDEAIKDAQGE